MERLSCVAWKYNKSVYVALNSNTVEPLSQVQRWNRQKQAMVAISQSFLINQYNKRMVGVHRADQNIATRQIAIKTKKWWWAFFAWNPDMVFQNAWIACQINRQSQDPNLDLLAFRREIVDNYLKKYVCPKQSERPKWRILPAKRRVKDKIFLHGIGHFSSSFMAQKRCWFEAKIRVNDEDHCFKQWYDIQ